MGQNLSLVWPDESLDVLSPGDALNDVILAILWAGSVYLIGMIFCTVKLVDRWRGKREEHSTSFGSVLGAMIMSLVWPLVLIVLALSNS